MGTTSARGINPYEDPVEVREQVYTRCYGCDKAVLVEIRYPKGHKPIAIDYTWCEQCQADAKKKVPAWIQCPNCEDYWCTIHKAHAFECSCPDVYTCVMDGWNPYVEGGEE